MFLGITVENLLGERVKMGEGKDATWEAKYELDDLLDPDFRVPRDPPKPKKPKAGTDGLAMLMALAAQKGSGVKLWTVKPS